MENNSANILTFVKDKMNSYKVEQVDCFEKPQSIAIGTINKDFAAYFIMLIKLAKSYYFDTYAAKPDFYDMIEEKMSEYLGIETVKVKVNGNLNTKIREIIDGNYPVVVPINLRKLYYSEHYLVNDCPHLVVVKGYDEEKQLYHILDGIQCKFEDELQRYNDFVIRYEDLEECFEAYSTFCEQDVICYYKKNKDLDETELLKWILLQWTEKIQKREFVQKYFLEFIFSIVKEKIDNGENVKMEDLIADNQVVMLSSRSFVNAGKFKSVACKELNTILERYENGDVLARKLDDILERLMNIWLFYTNRTVLNIYKMNFSILEKEPDEKILKIEDELHDVLLEVINFIDSYNTNYTKANNISDKFICENNADGVIYEKNNNIIFKFDNDKCYNSWIFDDCPKILLSTSNNVVRVSTKMKIIHEENKLGFHAGLFFRTVEGNLFCWALENYNNFIFDFVGKCTIKLVQNTKKFHDDLELFLEFSDNKVQFGEVIEGQDRIYGSYDINSILQVGVMCKTWEECKALEVEFSHYYVTCG